MSKNKFHKRGILIVSIISCISIGLTACKDETSSDSEVLNIERPADIGSNSSSTGSSSNTDSTTNQSSVRSDYNSNTNNNKNLNTGNNFSTDNPANNANTEPNYPASKSKITGGNTGSTMQGH